VRKFFRARWETLGTIFKIGSSIDPQAISDCIDQEEITINGAWRETRVEACLDLTLAPLKALNKRIEEAAIDEEMTRA
jgi:hypothetical protein